MIVVSHPTGSSFVRALLQGLFSSGWLDTFHTTLAFDPSQLLMQFAPRPMRDALLRRSYPLPQSRIICHPVREMLRVSLPSMGVNALSRSETGWASIEQVGANLDRAVANYLFQNTPNRKTISGVYCYEDFALHTFEKARDLGLTCFYDLPIPYWESTQRLLREEAARYPEWEPTLGGTRDSTAKLARKTDELILADVVICNSKFTYDSLPESIQREKTCVIAEYGAPDTVIESPLKKISHSNRLRFLFVGSMTQRKGLADLFAAMKLLGRHDIELVVMGTPAASPKFYRQQYADFTYEKPRPHSKVLELMQTCDVFVFPSIIEGRGLVQLEAMSCGLPLITTPNATGEDLVDDGRNGFLVPIRCPESIAEKMAWFSDNRDRIPEMGQCAQRKISSWTWEKYRRKILAAISAATNDIIGSNLE